MVILRQNFLRYPDHTIVVVDDDGRSDDDDDEFEDCVICFNTLRSNVRTLQCGHKFHMACLSTWLRLHRNCPTCRARVVAD